MAKSSKTVRGGGKSATAGQFAPATKNVVEPNGPDDENNLPEGEDERLERVESEDPKEVKAQRPGTDDDPECVGDMEEEGEYEVLDPQTIIEGVKAEDMKRDKDQKYPLVTMTRAEFANHRSRGVALRPKRDEEVQKSQRKAA